MLFSFFPPIQYNKVDTTDIFRDYKTYFNRVLKKYKPRSYQIQGSVRPEQLADKLYNNQQLYWVLLMLNDVYDPFYGWITTQEISYQYAEQKYSLVGGNQVIYLKDINGNLYYDLVEDPKNRGHWYHKGDVDMNYIQYNGTLVPVDMYESAILANEAKRNIKIISPTDINSFMNDFLKEMEKHK